MSGIGADEEDVAGVQREFFSVERCFESAFGHFYEFGRGVAVWVYRAYLAAFLDVGAEPCRVAAGAKVEAVGFYADREREVAPFVAYPEIGFDFVFHDALLLSAFHQNQYSIFSRICQWQSKIVLLERNIDR